MSTQETVNLFLGFDPAGRKKFGWSICREVGGILQPCPITGLADNAWDAINKVQRAIAARDHLRDLPIRAAGIDAPLMWDRLGDDQGRRQTDRVLTNALKPIGGPTNRVLSVNSLAGSVAVQGVLLVRHLSAKWDLKITESHPKVLDYLLANGGNQYNDEHQMALALMDRLNAAPSQDHERDATLSAISAWATLRKRSSPNWQNLYDLDNGLFNPSGITVSYWMPIPAANQPH